MNNDIEKLIQGNHFFRQKYFGVDSHLFESLVAQGQQPQIMIIACSDSRVDPAMIFNCQPGELFMVRNIANLIPPCENNETYHGTSAALEFGVCFLKVKHIIIFGHSRCGGIQALLENGCSTGQKAESFIEKWMELARSACDIVMAEHSHCSLQEKTALCSHYALLNSLKNLKTFPWIKEKIDAGFLELHTWYFDMETGGIVQYDAATHQWLSVQE